MTRKARFWVMTTLAIILAAAAGDWVWWSRFATYHFTTVQEGVLYRSGNRSMRQFAAGCRKGNIRTVVMLIGDAEAQQEPFKSQVEFCRQHGIKLERISIMAGHRPTTEQVRQFLTIAANAANQPVLVHCAQGVRRTAMMVAAYQRSILEYDAAKTKQAILPWGRKPERLNDIRGFIDDYDPATRTVAASATPVQQPDAD